MDYTFTMMGTAADGQTWEVTGDIKGYTRGDFPLVVDDAMKTSFRMLTGGKAVYGKPGIGCKGPYQIKSFTVVED